jgi:hypothetical protein
VKIAFLSVIFSFVLITLFGCASTNSRSAVKHTLRVTEVTTSAIELKRQYQPLSEAVLLHNMSDDVRAKLNLADQKIQDLIDKVELLFKSSDVMDAVVTIDDLRRIRSDAKIAYRMAKSAIADIYSDLDPMLQAELSLFDQRAVAVDLAFNDLKLAAESKDATSFLLDVIAIAAAAERVSNLARQ